MTAQEIINKFELYMDDTSELSDTEALDLCNKIYQKVSADRPWEKLKKVHQTTVSGTTIDLPDDFHYIVANYNFTDASYEAERPKVLVGDNFTPYDVVSFSDRRRYYQTSGKAYLDLANDQIVFTVAPSNGDAVEFDYIYLPDDLGVSDTPWFPARFHDVIYHGMCADDFAIQQSEKARSYMDEHLAAYRNYIDQMAYWNSQLVQI